MASRPQTVRTLLRATTSLRGPTTQNPLNFSHFQIQTRSRSPSPPPPYQSRNITLLASTQWTRFHTPYTYTSVRTFTRSPATRFPSSTPPSSSPDAAADIESVIDEIQELYGTARDEFDIAAEETEKNTTYAEDDRAAAREELDRLLEFYQGAVEGGDRAVAEEVKRRVGGKVRELEQAVLGLEESVKHGD